MVVLMPTGQGGLQDDQNLSISYGSDNGGNIFQDSLLIENGTGIRLSYIYDHDWYKSAPTGGVNYELANIINDNIYTKGRVSVGGVTGAWAILDVDGGMGNDLWNRKTRFKNQTGLVGHLEVKVVQMVKIDKTRPLCRLGPHDQTNCWKYGIDYQLFSSKGRFSSWICWYRKQNMESNFKR